MFPSILGIASVLALDLLLFLKITIIAEKLLLQINKGQKDMQNESEIHKKIFQLYQNVHILWVFPQRKGTISGCIFLSVNGSTEMCRFNPESGLLWINALVVNRRCFLLSHVTEVVFVLLKSSVFQKQSPAQSRLFSMTLSSHCRAFFNRRRIRICLLSHAFFLEEKKGIKEGRWKTVELIKIQ